MAPSRKRGSNKAKAATELSLGDLVLAKVKGFPAWPAKVSRPEDWERVPDPKKYFVQFFGTQEIAFVGPAEVQAFTSESKSKLLTRCTGKTVKYFSQAVREICKAFEELQQNELGGADDNTDRAPRCDDGHAGGEVKASHTELRKQDEWSKYVFDAMPLLGDARNDVDLSGVRLKKQVVTTEESSLFHDYSKMFKKVVKDGTLSAMESEASAPNQIGALSVKDETKSTGNLADMITVRERIQSSKASSSSPYSVEYDVGRDARHHNTGRMVNSVSSGASGHLKVPSGSHVKSANGQKSSNLMVGSKRKVEDVFRHVDDSKSSVHEKDWPFGKVASRGSGKLSFLGANRPESNPRGSAMKNQLKNQKHLAVVKSPELTVSSPGQHDGNQSKQKSGQINQELSRSNKKYRHVDMRSDVIKGALIMNGKNKLEPEICDDVSIPPLQKRQRTLEMMYDLPEGKKSFNSSAHKTDLPKKRRAVRLYDDDDEVSKTPVHGGSLSASKVGSSAVTSVSDRTDELIEISCPLGEDLKGSSGDGSRSKECVLSSKLISQPSKDVPLQLKGDDLLKLQLVNEPGSEDLIKQPVMETKKDLLSPTKSPVVTAVKFADHQKHIKPPSTGSSTGLPGKIYNGSVKIPNLVSGVSISSLNQASNQKSRPFLSGERPKGTSKMSIGLNEAGTSLDSQKDHYSMKGERLEDSKERPGSVTDPKAADSSSSMRHLIAAAQAKRRLAQMQNAPHGNGSSVLTPTANLQGRSSSPFAGHVSPSGGVNVTPIDALGVHSQTCFDSPSRYPFSSKNQLASDELEDKKLNSTHQLISTTLSGGTEAAVARDAFEGMIETLSRTKESIGRATRLAIDCAKYGIANEVVDLLIRKLENETSLHRKVDLFFLVDSITQCSHSQKGIAGASYIPAVQAVLPRFLGAAAPPGANAQENRRQCLKVLRLWLERKILPETVLRHCMDDIASSNDDRSGGLPIRRPSRAERSVDDPIREMEGMLVDEYGSNVTFNLPGFLSSHGFVDNEEDEDDDLSNGCKEFGASPLEAAQHVPVGVEGNGTPVDRRHHILEDVDGELEMEDVSGHPKEEAGSPVHVSENVKQEMYLDAELDSSDNNLVALSTPEGSPPLPLEPPPQLPPLPSSPPPPLPPLLSPSPPPPPPPPASILSQPPQPPLLPSGPTQTCNVQSLLPSQVPPQVLLQPQSVLPPKQSPLPPECGIQTGSHLGRMAGSTSQQVPCFLSVVASDQCDQSAYSSHSLEYGHNHFYGGPQTVHSSQPFPKSQQVQQCQAVFGQRSFPPVPVPQPPSNHFAFNKPSVQQHLSHPPTHHPQRLPQPPLPPPSHLYPSASHSEGLKRFADEPWRSASVEFKADGLHSTWVNGGRTPSCPSTSFTEAAYFRPPERPPTNNGYQVSAPNPALGGPPISGRNINQTMPPRPDMSALNCWRPV